MKALYYGNNLQVLRDSIATESVDLIYLDPPFNSYATYNIGLLGESGRDRMRGRTAACSHQRSKGRASISVTAARFVAFTHASELRDNLQVFSKP